jgi:acyl-[acyl-carrier-protein]-phospholipid O-acyltransferase/long-chain-fatty-acid--[acyl-carrier-protein] ligase
MTGLVATLIGLAIAGGLLAAFTVARKRQCGFAQAIALLKLRALFDLHLPDQKEASTGSHRPVVHLYSRQSGLDVAVLWAALDRHCLHVLHEDDQRSLLLFGVRLFARTAHAGDHSAIETALAEGRSITLGFPQNAEPAPETLTAYRQTAGLTRKHGALLQALHVRGSRLSLWSVWSRSEAPRHLLPRLRLAQSALLDLDDPQPARNGATDPRDEDRIHDLLAARPASPAMISTAACSWHFATPPTATARRGRCSKTRWAASCTYKRLLIGARVLARQRFAEDEREPGEAHGRAFCPTPTP